MFNRTLSRLTLLAVSLLSGGLVLASAGMTTKQAKAPQQVDFVRDVQPILKASCFQCHGPERHEGNLRLDMKAFAFKGGVGGKSINPGRSAKSLLLQRILGMGGKPRMPIGFAPLSPQQTELIRAWLDQGADWPEGAGEKHWAYINPVRRALPRVKNAAWVRNPIDNFILARLEKEGLQPSPQASREILIRRVSLDLIGLPPTVEEVDAFLADKSPDAYNKVVDRLLASPHYGERWARPWLDLARYADTNGYEKDDRRSIWPYRDWVINAFNKDMPYDEFTIEQIAGDLLPNATLDQKVATGFNRNTMLNEEGGVDQAEQRWLTNVDRVGTTASVWLGTTLACAECHNHKYDPFTQKEFYQFLAYYEHCSEPALELISPEQEAKRKALQAEQADLEKSLKATADDLTKTKAANDRIAAVKKEIAAIKGPTTLVFAEKPDADIPSTNVRVKGAFLNKAELVHAGVPAILNPPRAGSPQNRLGLAYWLVDLNNPLTARVAVNRLWEQYFGHGIVETSEDFGTQGQRPSHLELLDWLSTEFLRQSWSMKAIHRLIVTSATYRQSSRVTPALNDRDPLNHLLARGPRFRMEAEMIRDAALESAGMLSHKLGGPSVFPPQPDGVWVIPYSGDTWNVSPGEDKYRRGLYTFWRRTAPYPAFATFDATSREFCTVRRIRTNTPLQALNALNDPAYLEAARGLAMRMMKQPSADAALRVTYGFRLCVARRPKQLELNRLVVLYDKELKRYMADEKAALALTGDKTAQPDTAMKAAWTMVGNVLLNMDETLTKE